MPRRKTKRRLEMGEEAWNEYQKERKLQKVRTWRARNVEKVSRWRRRRKNELIEYKGGKCEHCGFDKPWPECYDFHHRDPSEKNFQIGGCTRSIKILKVEADKCVMLCAICHRGFHVGRIKLQNNLSLIFKE